MLQMVLSPDGVRVRRERARARREEHPPDAGSGRRDSRREPLEIHPIDWSGDGQGRDRPARAADRSGHTNDSRLRFFSIEGDADTPNLAELSLERVELGDAARRAPGKPSVDRSGDRVLRTVS